MKLEDLHDKKIIVNNDEQYKILQKLLFDLGSAWGNGPTDIRHATLSATVFPHYIIVYNTNRFYHGDFTPEMKGTHMNKIFNISWKRILGGAE